MLQEFIDIAKHHKMAWVENTQQGDMPPTVIGIRDGKPIILVIAPQVDKHMGLRAANLLRIGLGIDAIVFITDSHVILTKDKSPEETRALYEKYREPGSMQKACDENGACNLGEIADCICVNYIDSKNFKFSMGSFPYFYHGKDGGAKFQWMEEHNSEMLDCPVVDDIKPFEEERDKHDGPVVSGLIPNTMKSILEQPSCLDVPQTKLMMNLAGFDSNNPEHVQRALFHMEVAVRKALDGEKFIVMECLSYNGTYEDFLTQMVDKYRVIKRVKDSEDLSSEQLLELLVQIEQATDDPQELEKIREAKKQIEELSGR